MGNWSRLQANSILTIIFGLLWVQIVEPKSVYPWPRPLQETQKNSDYSFQKFADQLRDNRNHVRSLEDGLKLLPASLHKNYALVYGSKSIQPQYAYEDNEGHTIVEPRALMFNEDASFVATFTSESGPGEANSIEVVQFNKSNRAFEVYSVSFPLETNDWFAQPKPAQSKNCTGCHQVEAGGEVRAIWGNFSNNEGVFGSKNGLLSADEAEMLKYFNHNIYAKNLRYQQLVRDMSDPLSPYAVPSDKSANVGFSKRPNERLRILLNRWNSKRLFRILSTSPFYRSIRLELVWLLQCQNDSTKLQSLLRKVNLELDDWSLEMGMSTMDYTDGWTTTIELVSEMIVGDERLDHIAFMNLAHGLQLSGHVNLPKLFETSDIEDLSFEQRVRQLGGGLRLNPSGCKELAKFLLPHLAE